MAPRVKAGLIVLFISQPQQCSLLTTRQSAVVFCLLFLAAVFSWLGVKHLRLRHENPKYVPTAWLQDKWVRWHPYDSKRRYSTTLMEWRSIQEARRTPSPTSTLRAFRSSQNVSLTISDDSRNLRPEANTNRQPSIRSVMTLPAYSESARATEQVVGREGERAGVDTVLQYPETAAEEELRRDEREELEYRSRSARRQAHNERLERQRLRRDARIRGDRVALEELRLQSQLRGQSTQSVGDVDSTSAALRDQQSRERGRRISSVSYADLGVARHDGSRVRAGSDDSDRPLLTCTAPLPGRPGRVVSQPPSIFHTHTRNQSRSSLRFTAQDASDDEGDNSDLDFIPTPWDSRRASASTNRLPPSAVATPWDSRRASASTNRATTSHSNLVNHGRTDELLPPSTPPSYGEASRPASRNAIGVGAPAYSPAHKNNVPRLPAFAPLPQIEITPLGLDTEGGHDHD